MSERLEVAVTVSDSVIEAGRPVCLGVGLLIIAAAVVLILRRHRRN